MKKQKVILAYSGGLDTSCCLHWLKEKGFDVICFSANLGSEFLPRQIKKKAKRGGALRVYVRDLRKEFSQGYILPALAAGVVYQDKYLLSTALGRPLIAKQLVEIAKSENARFVAHGCSAKGNDQVRIELAVKSLCPKLEVIAPLRQWNLNSREEEINYARKNSLPLEVTKKKIYSIDKNIWGVSIEAGILEDLKNPPPQEAFLLTKPLRSAAAGPDKIEIDFHKGKPVKINKKSLSLVNLIGKLNKIGGKHSIGRTDLVEDRITGIKSREVYEAPAAWILHKALREIEEITLSKDMLQFKKLVSRYYSELVYRGLWFCELKKSLDAFVQRCTKNLCGRVILELYKGNVITLSRSSPHCLYRKNLATYGEKDIFDKGWAEGFINILGIPFQK